MKVFKVYNATSDMWLDHSGETFYAHAVYGTAFPTYEEAEEAADVTEARWAGHDLRVIEVDMATTDDWTEEDEAAAQAEHDYQVHIDELEEAHNRQLDGEEREREEAAEYDPYYAICESRFGLPGNVNG